MSEFFLQLFCDLNESYSLIIEDDGQVTYAYLLKDEEIIGDVWLYNQKESPLQVDWRDVEKMPFLNPKEFIKENISPIINENEIKLDWHVLNNGETVKEVDIFINEKLIAKLAPGYKPGWSKTVVKSGPLANIYI